MSYRDDPEVWRQGGQTLAWQGQSLFVRSQGQGPPLLLLHGFPTSSWDWKELWADLVATHRVVTFDYLGFGFSSKPRDGAYTVGSYADQAEAVCAHLGVTQCHVLAHDLGDTVAQELLARDRERREGTRPGALELQTVALLNGGIFPETHHPRLVQRLLASPLGFVVARLVNRRMFEKSMTALFGPRTPPSASDLAGFWAGVAEHDGTRNYHRLIRYMRERRLQRARWVPPLLAGPVPVTLLCGLSDPVSGQHVVRRYKELKPNAEIVELPDVGHYPQTEAPALVLDGYLRFRQRHETNSG